MFDAVYTWVDGSDPAYARARDAAARELGLAVDPQRDRDDLDLLRYSLRSLDRYAPWIRRVVLVTPRPQVPGWLDREAVRVVHEDEILPQAPVFNSDAVEFGLRNVPGLSERFLYLCDDMLLARRLEPEDLLRRGRIRVFLGAEALPRHGGDAFARKLRDTAEALDRRWGARERRQVQHGPSLLHRDLLAVDDPAVERTVGERFRREGHVNFQTWCLHRLLEERPEEAEVVPAWEAFAAGTKLVRLDNDRRELFRARLGMLLWPHRFLCLNDDLGAAPDPGYVGRVRRLLERRYPRPSRFERTNRTSRMVSPSTRSLRSGGNDPA